MELAINGNVRAQRDILNAVRAYESQDEEKAAVDELVREAADVQEAIWEEMLAAPTAVQKVNYVEAAQRVRDQLGLNESAAKSGTGASGKESDTAQRDAAPAAPPADSAPQPENGMAPAAPPVVSPSPPPPAGQDIPRNHRMRHGNRSPPGAAGAKNLEIPCYFSLFSGNPAAGRTEGVQRQRKGRVCGGS
jgi:hypothetical protein